MKAIFLLLLTILPITTLAQQKRQTPAKPQPKATPAPAPTFETLLPADSYTIYTEVRGAGQLVRSNALNELLEPVLKLAGPPKEFKSVVKWLNAHADEVMTSRLLVATWPTNPNFPQAIIAIEFASAEEAAKFVTPLNEFLPTVLPPSEPEASPSASPNKQKPAAPPMPGFHLQRLGSLVVITPKQWTMKQLRPAGSKLLSEDANFQTAHNRFSSEPVFVYIDVKAIEREEEERRKRSEATQREEEERMKREMAAAAEEKKELTEAEKLVAGEEFTITEAEPGASLTAVAEPGKEPPPPDPMSNALSQLGMAFFIGESDWPDGVALALSFEGDSIDLRGLLLNAAGEKSDAVPFWPKLIPGAAIAPESPSIFPADTEIFVTMSLDLPQVYAALSKAEPKQFLSISANDPTINKAGYEPPFAVIEKRLKINIKDDLLPLLGSEVAVALPMQGMGIVGVAGVMTSVPETKENSGKAPVVAIEVRDKERMRALLPKLIESFGFKGASALASTERREDTELVSYANVFAYAFVGDFLVLSADAASTRRIVDAYLKHETLAADPNFKNYTRWQPRQLHGQIYVSPALMESLKTWSAQSNSPVSEKARALLAPASMLAQPVTYSLSNEGNGPLHELHLPRNLVLMAVTGISGEVNPSPELQKERMTIGAMYMIAGAEQRYKEGTGAGSYGTLEQLMAENLVPKDTIEKSGYRFEVTVSGDKFEVSAAPVEYGKTGKMSYFIDHTYVVRGADRSGASATSSDPPIQ